VKICQVLGGNEEGGLEKHFVELCNQLTWYEEVHVIAHEKYRTRFDQSIVFHAVDLSKGRRNLLVLYRLFRLINKINPDIVHAHANKAVEMIRFVKPLLHPSIKCIATLHSKKRNLKSFEMFDHVIGVSHEVLKALKNPHQSVVYNGIDITAPKRDSHFLEQFGIKDEFVVCAVGRLEKVKNFPLLIRAIRDLDVKLLIVGEGSQETYLRNLVKEIHIEDKVVFTGFRKDALEIIAHSNVCAISSEREGFPYVVVEALLLYIPVISTDVSDMKEILPSSYIVPLDDETYLSKKIHFMQTHYNHVLQEYQEVFDFSANTFTLATMTQETLSVYKKVLQ